MAVPILIAVYLLLLSYYDWKEKAVPVLLLWTGGAAALLYQIYEGFSEALIWQDYLAGRLLAMIPGMILTAAAWGTKKAGPADGIVLLLLGILLGYQKCLFLFAASLFLAAIFSAGVLLLGKGTKDTGIPYLPFVTAAYLLGVWM